MGQYQFTGISFETAMEAGAFLQGQGFGTVSEGFAKTCEVTGEIIEASYTLTQGRCFIAMRPRYRIEHAGRYLGSYRRCAIYQGDGGVVTAWKPGTGTHYQIADASSYSSLVLKVDRVLDREGEPA